MSLGRDDVVSLEQKSFFGKTFTVAEVASAIGELVHKHTGGNHDPWAVIGIKCRVLRADGKGWELGKVRISLEFIPDPDPELDPELEVETEIEAEANEADKSEQEPKSPLDEFRQASIK